MAKQNRTTLKGYFETGDTPSQAQYADLIDSTLNLSEANNSILVTNITASGNISASENIYGASAYFDKIEIANGGTIVNRGDGDNLPRIEFGDDQLTLTSVQGENVIISQGITTGTITSTSTTGINISATGNISSSIISTGSFGSIILSNLPTIIPTTTGSLWLSGSNAEGTSKHLMVFTG